MTTTNAPATNTTQFFPTELNYFNAVNYLLTTDGGRLTDTIALMRFVLKWNMEATEKTQEKLLAEGAPVHYRDRFVLLHDRLGNALYFIEQMVDDLKDYDEHIVKEALDLDGFKEGPMRNKIAALLWTSTGTDQLVGFFEGFEKYAMDSLEAEKVTMEQAVKWVAHAREQVTLAKAADFAIQDAANLFEEEIAEMIKELEAKNKALQEEEDAQDDTNGKLDALLDQI